RADAVLRRGDERAQAREHRQARPGDRRGDDSAAGSQPLPVRARRPGRRRALAPRLGGRILAARPGRAGAARVAQPGRLRRPRQRLRRGPLDGAGRRRGRRARAGAGGVAVRPLRLARRGRLGQPRALRDAEGLRRAPREEPGAMTATARKQQENPLAEGLALRRTPDPCALVIFGASGDLTHKKLMPALYALAVRRLLPQRFAILGVARTEGDADSFRQDMEAAVKQHGRDPFRQETWDELAAQLHYVSTDFADTSGEHTVPHPP